MSVLQQDEQHVAPAFDEESFAKVISGEAAPLAAKRRAAFAAYAGLPFPAPTDEEWRRTDPASVPVQSVRRMATLPRQERVTPDSWDEQFDVVVSVNDQGFAFQDRTGVTRDGTCRVLSLEDAAKECPELLEKYLRGSALPPEVRKFEALNAAYWNFGLLVHLPARKALKHGVLVRYAHAASGAALLPRLLVIAEDASEVRVVEHFTSPDDAEILCIGAREFYAAQGANLKIVSVQEWGARSVHVGEDWARVGRDGRVDWVTLTLGGKVSKMMVGSDVNAPNANAYLSGVFFAEGDQHFDQRTLQLHSAPDTYSNLLYKGAVKDRGHSVYQGVINAKPGAIRVDAYQMNNNLILNEGARADSLPGLEIDADDLKCSHGATIGSLDPDQLYYLRSRGLSQLDARRLIVAGFFEEVIEKVPYAFVQERLREHIERKMN